MTITLHLNGQRYTAVPTEVYDRMVEQLGETLPDYPQASGKGRRPARASLRVAMARQIIRRRAAAGWTQAELAQRAKLRPETISRLESGKHEPQTATLAKIEDALKRADV